MSMPMPRPTRARTGAQAAAPAAPAGFKQGERDRIRLDQFIVMPQRTRDLNLKHVVSLADSIAAIGLIHPPAVDRGDRLLAGAHRFAALLWLQDHALDRFLELFPDGVPVWRMDLNAESDMDLALAVEISENEQRRDYQPAEILKLAERLKAAGYHYAAEGGRPRSEDRPLMPALEIIVGKSVRQLRRILNPPPVLKTRTNDLVSDLKKFLEASRRIATLLAPASELPEVAALQAELGRVDRIAGKALAALDVLDTPGQ